MDPQMRMAKQVMDMQKVAFTSMINNMILFWDQTEKMLGSFMEKAPWIPDEGRKAFREWVDGNKKGCETYKNAVDEGFTRLSGCFNGKPSEGL